MYQTTTKIPELIDPQPTYTTDGREAWRVLGIMAEFAAATERMRNVRPAVSMFGSARIKPGHPYYEKTEQIARLLVISPRTVERHRENILSKLGMRDRVELTRWAIRHGLVEP